MIRLYSTLSGKIEPFSPAGDVVKMYVCGVTPYAASHVGHAMRAVVFDVLRRYLEFRGYQVRHIENFTDIDDKMIQGAKEEGVTTHELAERNILVYLDEINALNVLPAHEYPRATDEIPKIQEMVGVLEDKGFAYAVNGNVYFRVRRHEDYGKLSRRSLDSMQAGARVEVDENKEEEMDFALWKSQKPGEPAWDSPWGPGRPGWHIECSAMSLAYLGETVDIHGGGQDLVFPHHENEIAQSESYLDSGPFVRFWAHNGLVRLGEDKMSKSLGNLVTTGEALKRYSSDALRLFFLSSHYRSPLTYSERGVTAQERGAERLRNALVPDGTAANGDSLDAQPYRERFIVAMDEDLNTPRAIAALFDLAHEINRAHEHASDVSSAQRTLRELAGVLGLTLAAPKEESGRRFYGLFHLLLDTDAELRSASRENIADRMRHRLADRGIEMKEFLGAEGADVKEPEDMSGQDVATIIELLIEARTELRSAKQFDLADHIRSRLEELGFALEDTPRGTEWKLRTH